MKGRRLKIVFGIPVRYFVNGTEVPEAEYRSAVPCKLQEMVDAATPPDGHRPGIWPMYSDALAVHPDQVAEANARAAKNNLGVRYETGTGRCEIASDGDKVKLVALEGFVNKQAGYR